MEDDERTLARFRRRMSAIEAELPDPPLPGPSSMSSAGAPAGPSRRRQALRRDAPSRQVYLLLTVVLAVLAAVAAPYLGHQARPPAGLPASPSQPTSNLADALRWTLGEAGRLLRTTPVPTTPPASPAASPVGPCPLTPYVYEGPMLWEQWAAHDWALIEGRLRPGGEGELSVLVTGGPFAGPVRNVSWPHGYRVNSDGQGLVLERPDGSLAARQGDLVMVGGNPMGGGTFAACGIRVVRDDAAR